MVDVVDAEGDYQVADRPVPVVEVQLFDMADECIGCPGGEVGELTDWYKHRAAG
jgi:hypothetical protein